METVDLHGVSHYDVSDILDKKFWECMNSNKKLLKIITGNSDRMKQFCVSSIKEYGFHYQIGDPINKGYILVYFK